MVLMKVVDKSCICLSSGLAIFDKTFDFCHFNVFFCGLQSFAFAERDRLENHPGEVGDQDERVPTVRGVVPSRAPGRDRPPGRGRSGLGGGAARGARLTV